MQSYQKELKRMIVREQTFYCIIITMITFLLIMYLSLQNYTNSIIKKELIINIKKKNEEVKEKNDEINHLKNPPQIYNPIEAVICENEFIKGYYILTDNINKFIFWNHFILITVICSGGNKQIIKNQNNYKNLVSIFLNKDLSFWNGKETVIANKKELECSNDETPTGLIYTKRDNSLISICKNITDDENKKYFSPIFANPKRNIYGERKKYYCGNNPISNINFIVNQYTHYLEHIEILCLQESKKNDLMFNKVTINFGDFVDKVSYFKNNIEFPCDECSKGGNFHSFKCPNNMKISGHYE